MRLVFVNHAHPDLTHVSGMRLGYFAKAMAKRGHQVVLLTATLPDASSGDHADGALSERLRNHDWTAALVVAVKPRRRRTLELIRRNRVPPPIRRALTLSQFLMHGGVFADWQVPAMPVARQIAREFRPELAWGTFGNTSTLVATQAVAHNANCPWVMDVKDPWANFVPAGLRRWIAWRFRDAVGWTANSERHQYIAERWLHQNLSKVLYSGVADAFYVRCTPAASAKHDLVLVGSTYDDDNLHAYLATIAAWACDLPQAERDALRFVYAGSDTALVASALRDARLPCETFVTNQLPIDELADLTRNAFVNSYLRTPVATGFHHKLLELLVCGRPVICYPDESRESMRLAAKVETNFASCGTPSSLRQALVTAWSQRVTGPTATRVPAWRWADFCADLEEFLQVCAQRRAP